MLLGFKGRFDDLPLIISFSRSCILGGGCDGGRGGNLGGGKDGGIGGRGGGSEERKECDRRGDRWLA